MSVKSVQVNCQDLNCIPERFFYILFAQKTTDIHNQIFFVLNKGHLLCLKYITFSIYSNSRKRFDSSFDDRSDVHSAVQAYTGIGR